HPGGRSCVGRGRRLLGRHVSRVVASFAPRPAGPRVQAWLPAVQQVLDAARARGGAARRRLVARQGEGPPGAPCSGDVAGGGPHDRHVVVRRSREPRAEAHPAPPSPGQAARLHPARRGSISMTARTALALVLCCAVMAVAPVRRGYDIVTSPYPTDAWPDDVAFHTIVALLLTVDPYRTRTLPQP